MDAVKLLGGLLGSNATGGNVLGSLLGGAGAGGGGGGGLGALAGLLGGGGGGGGGLGALAGMLGGGGGGATAGGGGGGLGGLLGQLAGGQPAQAQPTEQDQALLLVRSMCNAAKADGQIDQDEVKNIVGRLGDMDEKEAQFLRSELQSPLNIQDFVQSVPQDMADKVYAFSLMGMRLDTKQEAQYLGALAQGLQLNPQTCNQIHDKFGAPKIFQ